MKLDGDIHVYHHNQDNHKLDLILEALLKLRSQIMAESAEVAAFRARVEAALVNVSADLQKLIDGATGLSPEDKTALEDLATKIEAVAAIVP